MRLKFGSLAYLITMTRYRGEDEYERLSLTAHLSTRGNAHDPVVRACALNGDFWMVRSKLKLFAYATLRQKFYQNPYLFW